MSHGKPAVVPLDSDNTTIVSPTVPLTDKTNSYWSIPFEKCRSDCKTENKTCWICHELICLACTQVNVADAKSSNKALQGPVSDKDNAMLSDVPRFQACDLCDYVLYCGKVSCWQSSAMVPFAPFTQILTTYVTMRHKRYVQITGSICKACQTNDLVLLDCQHWSEFRNDICKGCDKHYCPLCLVYLECQCTGIWHKYCDLCIRDNPQIASLRRFLLMPTVGADGLRKIKGKCLSCVRGCTICEFNTNYFSLSHCSSCKVLYCNDSEFCGRFSNCRTCALKRWSWDADFNGWCVMTQKERIYVYESKRLTRCRICCISESLASFQISCCESHVYSEELKLYLCLNHNREPFHSKLAREYQTKCVTCQQTFCHHMSHFVLCTHCWSKQCVACEVKTPTLTEMGWSIGQLALCAACLSLHRTMILDINIFLPPMVDLILQYLRMPVVMKALQELQESLHVGPERVQMLVGLTSKTVEIPVLTYVRSIHQSLSMQRSSSWYPPSPISLLVTIAIVWHQSRRCDP